MEMYDNPKHVGDTFEEENLSEDLRKAQKAEMIELKKIIKELSNKKGDSLSILDIGIGNARIPKHLSTIKKIWDLIETYEGIDISQKCIDISNKVITRLNEDEKMKVKLLDAVNLNQLNKKYDLIISTWFTVGNFYPFDFDFGKFDHNFDMSTNDKVTMILKQAYEMLNKDGEIVIGSMYIDNDSARKKQEEAYRNFGWEIITDKRDCCTATKDGWWSQRFTKQRIFEYLTFVSKEKISFIPLDKEDFAMLVRIKK